MNKGYGGSSKALLTCFQVLCVKSLTLPHSNIIGCISNSCLSQRLSEKARNYLSFHNLEKSPVNRIRLSGDTQLINKVYEILQRIHLKKDAQICIYNHAHAIKKQLPPQHAASYSRAILLFIGFLKVNCQRIYLPKLHT